MKFINRLFVMELLIDSVLSSQGEVFTMCGIMQGGVCRFAELQPGQFGLTKQLVLRLALPHISLLVVSIIYAVSGSLVLSLIRHATHDEDIPIRTLKQVKSSFVQQFLYRNESFISHEISLSHFTQELYELLQQYPKNLLILEEEKDNRKIFSFRSIFFTTTSLTSIGYGVDAPFSTPGRFFCIAYLFCGIPLYLITLADTAKFCTEGMNRMYTEYLKFKFRFRRRLKKWRKGTRSDSLAGNVGQVIIAGGDDDVAEFLWTHLEAAQFVEIPFLLVYGLLILYISFASYVVAKIEKWPLEEGFYFIMMSVLTVGFGDVVPLSESFALLHTVIVLLGLVLATTSIDVAGAYYIDKLHFFGRQLDDDPLSWLKAVQQRRIEAMKREAMRKLFETVTALHHIRFTTMKKLIESHATDKDSLDGLELPNSIIDPPTCLSSYNATADSVCLRWNAPKREPEGKRFWYTLTYKTRNPHWFGRNNGTIVDFITGENYEVKGLKSFTLYQFSLVVTTRYGCSKPVSCQEYTEPCTVPQSVVVDAISSETVTMSWKAPKKNNGVEKYVILYSQEPAPQFKYWNRFKCASTNRFTITNLSPDTRYIACVSAEHNFGLAAMSKSIRFRTKLWWHEEVDSSLLAPLVLVQKRLSIISSISTASALR